MSNMFIPFGVTAGITISIDSVGNLTMEFSHVKIIPSAYVPQVARAMRKMWDDWNVSRRNKLTKEVA